MDMTPEAATRFREGQQLLNRGKFEKAREVFWEIQKSLLPILHPHVEHHLGICNRLIKHQLGAIAGFRNALATAETDLHLAQIRRDYGMFHIDRKNLSNAHDMIQESCDTLRTLEESNPRNDEIRTEYAVSRGFMARVLFLEGDLRAARAYFWSAYKVLRGHAPYELNNLVWWIKAVSPLRRFSLAPRALRLAWQNHNWKRALQILGWTLCPSYARYHEAKN